MNLSMKWLSDYVKFEMPIRDYCEAMTMSGSKVEGYEIENENIKNVVVGKILQIDRHPDADKLVVCQVDVGEGEPIQIVTGASNLVVGDVVPVAKDKSLLPNGTKITKGKLRGVLSNGMLCSLGELGLTLNDFPSAIEDGIFVLNADECDTTCGAEIPNAIGLDDTTVEFEITSNRPDCMSVVGLARETAATLDLPFEEPNPVVKSQGDDINKYLSVEVENTTNCLRYVARVVKNVKIGPSPRWLRERLRASGVRPINNFVDITNYVMLEYGYPMHAFDIAYVNGNKIVVRDAKQGEKIVTLDGIERELSPEMLVISDEKAPVAVAGVMGGEYSGIMEDTNTVVFEAACFNGASVRRTAKKLGMRTEASARFEKGLDAQACAKVANRACELVQLLGCGEVVDGIIDVNNSSAEPVKVKFEPEWTNKFLGIDLTEVEMIAILEKLGFKVENGYVISPSFRIDIAHKADIAEEIARIYGYNNIPTTCISGVSQGKFTEMQKFERKINQTMLSVGCSEAFTYSFVSPKVYDKILLPSDSPLRDCVVITNPLGEDTSVMRTTTLPSMLGILSKNYNNRNASAWLYELGNEYIKDNSKTSTTLKNGDVINAVLPDERTQLTIGLYGNGADFFTLKGMVEATLKALNIGDWDIVACKDNPTFHPGRCAVISKNGIEFAVLGEAHPQVADNFEIGAKTYLAKLDVKKMFELTDGDKAYKPLPKFPASTRDLSLLCDVDTPVATLEKAIKEGVGKYLEEIKLFDVYQGAQVPQGKKSVSFSIIMRDANSTMTDEITDSAINRALKALESLGAVIRS